MNAGLVLVANPGSASRKYALYDGDEAILLVHVEQVNHQYLATITHRQKSTQQNLTVTEWQEVVHWLPELFQAQQIDTQQLAAIGLRVVAPGTFFQQHHLVDEHFIDHLKQQMTTAPIHIAASLEELKALRGLFANTPIVAVSDSAFHATKIPVSRYYGLPISDADQFHLHRYGYHGLSVESVVNQLKRHQQLAPKTIVCHLGSGASITAVKEGKSLDNTMGFSPLDGLVMSTRSGSVDPAAILALQQAKKMTSEQLSDYLHHASGLQGLSGISDDIRQLLEAEHSEPRAKLTLEVYVYHVVQGIAQMVATLNGVDQLVFTGTVGERSEPIRQRITSQLGWLPVAADKLIIVPTNEADSIARATITMVHSHTNKV